MSQFGSEQYGKLRSSVGASSRAQHFLSIGEFDEAERWARRAVQLWEEIYPDEQATNMQKLALSEMLTILADCCNHTGKADESAKLSLRASVLKAVS